MKQHIIGRIESLELEAKQNRRFETVSFWLIVIAVTSLVCRATFAAPAWHETPNAPHHRSIGVIRQGPYAGTAFLIDQQHVATAAHCVENGSRAVITFPGSQPIAATVLRRDDNEDVALLRLDRAMTDDRLPIPISEVQPPAGASIEICGYGGPTGKLRHFYSQQRADGQANSTVLNGDSGGPVIYRGHAVGCVSGGHNTKAFTAEDRATWKHVYPVIYGDLTRYKTAWKYPTPIRDFFGGRPTSSGYS